MQSFKRPVEKLFARLFAMVGINPDAAGNDFLKALRADALANRKDWQERLDVYLHGLQDCGAINASDAAELLGLASECVVPGPTYWNLTSPFLWILLGALAVLGWSTVGPGYAFVAPYVLTTAMAGGYAGWVMYPRPRRQPERLRNKLQTAFCAVFGTVIAVAVALFVPGLAKECYFAYAYNQHEAEVERFASDAEGMPALRKLAKEQLGLDVVLNSSSSSWLSTALALPGASPASIDMGPGYCLLSVDRDSLFHDFGIKDANLRTVWLKGVLIHELTHCVDITPDMPLARSDRQVGHHALAPAVAANAKDLESYVEASHSPQSRRWREAYADIAAVGYWRLTLPDGAAILIGTLREKRISNEKDLSHRTECWIDIANSAKPPESVAKLPQWADEIRGQAHCSLI